MPAMPAGRDCSIDIANECAHWGSCIIDIMGVFVRVSCPTGDRHTETNRPRQTHRDNQMETRLSPVNLPAPRVLPNR